MKQTLEWLHSAAEKNTSDIFIGAGRPVFFKIDGKIVPQSEDPLTIGEVEVHLKALYYMAGRSIENYANLGDDDFSVAVPELARFRVSAYRQRGTMAAVIRVVQFKIPDYRAMNIPEEVMNVSKERSGLVLVTGMAGSGKSTTLACVIDSINKTRNSHIITLEDPIEFLHRDEKSLISQREIASDTATYLTALRTCLRQAPDIILLGEMRDFETISAAMSAAETGQLVISTLHTSGAVNTVDRVIDVFPPVQQQQIRVMLALLLRSVVSQQLLPGKNGGLVPAFEIMHLNNSVRSLIRENKTHQIDGVISTSGKEGMVTMDAYIQKLFQAGQITFETAVLHARDPERMGRLLTV